MVLLLLIIHADLSQLHVVLGDLHLLLGDLGKLSIVVLFLPKKTPPDSHQ